MRRVTNTFLGVFLCLGLFYAHQSGAELALRSLDARSIGRENSLQPDDDLTASGSSASRLPQTTIQRDSGPPYENMFYAVGEGMRVQPKAGGLTAAFQPDFFQAAVRYNLPFVQSGGPPKNAEIRIGHLYYDAVSLSTSWLFSDNVNQVENNTQSGIIGICTFKGVVMIQLMENLRIAAKVGLVYLPLRSKFGFAGFLNESGYGRIYLGDEEDLRAQVAYDLELGNWNIRVYDQIRSAQPLLSERFGMNFMAGVPFDEQDRAGRYSFRSNIGGDNFRVNESDRDKVPTFSYINNQVGVTANRLLPTETRVDLGAYRMNYWYLGDDGGMSPRDKDVGFITFESERENLRFKPFASYRAFRYNEGEWKQEVRAGFSGPVTENIKFTANGGYFFGRKKSRDAYLVYARLDHQPRPLITQSLEYRRDVTAPEQDLENAYTYRLRKIFNQYLRGDLFVTYATYDDLDNNITGTTEWRGGMMFHSDISSKTTLRFGATYASVQYDNSLLGRWDRWTALAQLRYRFTPSFETLLTYRYQTRDSSLTGDSYDESLIMITLTKYFDAPQKGEVETDSP